MRHVHCAGGMLLALCLASCNQVGVGAARTDGRMPSDGVIPQQLLVIDFDIVDEVTGRPIDRVLFLPVYEVVKGVPIAPDPKTAAQFHTRMTRPSVISAGQPTTIVEPPVSLKRGRASGELYGEFFLIAPGYEMGYFGDASIHYAQTPDRLSQGQQERTITGSARITLKPSIDARAERVRGMLAGRRQIEPRELPVRGYLIQLLQNEGPIEVKFTEAERKMIHDFWSDASTKPAS